MPRKEMTPVGPLGKALERDHLTSELREQAGFGVEMKGQGLSYGLS